MGTMEIEMTNQIQPVAGMETEGERPVGIGPVIAGWHDGKPVYFVDIAYRDGSTKRMVWAKRRQGADQSVKNEAYRQRILLANKLRPEVVLTHDEASFVGLVSLLGGEAPHRRPVPLRAAA